MNDAPLVPAVATTGPYLAAKLRALDARLESVAKRVLAATDDAAAVHDLRVALRRTRTVLEVGRDVLGRFYVDEVRRALRDVHRATGALRDEEVLLATVTELGIELLDVQAWIEGRRRREQRLRRSLVRLVQAGEIDRGRDLLGALLAFRVKPSRDRRLGKFARRAVDDARRGVDRRRGASPDNVDTLHRLRIAYKRLRYTADTFADALPSDLAALAQGAARFQGKLGDLHDVDMAIACIRRARTLSSEGRSELLAALDRLRIERAASYAREVGVAFVPSLAKVGKATQAEGSDALRKISTR
jgi:CHAD domain-containing protein